MHAYRFMHTSFCRFMHAYQMLLMCECVRHAYCKKCRVTLGAKSFGW
jgi:hypothetical protein